MTSRRGNATNARRSSPLRKGRTIPENLVGKKIAILVADGFEQIELTSPKHALEAAGATTRIVSPNPDRVHGWNHDDPGESFAVDEPLSSASPDDFDALLLPGGLRNPDSLRASAKATQFVRSFFQQHKPVGAICHAPWLLAEAGVLEKRRITSTASIRTDLINAGAVWVDEPVVCDEGLVTSRMPEDLNAFNAKLVEEVHEGKHQKQTV